MIEHAVDQIIEQCPQFFRLDLVRDFFGPLAVLVDQPLATYGRTAFIYCDGYPAVELLEIVAPE